MLTSPPAPITINPTHHGEKGTQLHNCASDSLTSRWRFFAVGVIASAALLFLAPLHWTRWPFHCDSAPWLRAGGPGAAHHRGTCSGSRPLSSCTSSTGRARFPSASSISTSGRRRATLGPSTSSHLAKLLESLPQLLASCQHCRTKGTLCHLFAQSYS